MFPASFIFDYQHIVYDFHEGVEAFVTEQGEGGIGLEGIGGEEDVAEIFEKLSTCCKSWSVREGRFMKNLTLRLSH